MVCSQNIYEKPLFFLRVPKRKPIIKQPNMQKLIGRLHLSVVGLFDCFLKACFTEAISTSQYIQLTQLKLTSSK